MKTSLVYGILALGAAGLLSACTNPTGTAGTMSSVYKGTITGIEIVDLDTNKYDSSTNTLIGGLTGALIGGLLSDHSTGTLIGAGVGAAAGGLGSQGMNRSDGVRLSLDSDNGDISIDVPFNCNYKLGQRVRLIGSSGSTQVQIFDNGAYHTATEQKTSQCPATYEKYKNGLYSGE